MYLFFSEICLKNELNIAKNTELVKNFSSIVDLKNNLITTKFYEIGSHVLFIVFVTPKNKEFFYFKSSECDVSFYVIGDIGPFDKKKIIEEITRSYRYRFSDLIELPFLYNLIIIDHQTNLVYFLCDSYHCQSLYYSKINENWFVSNTLKAFSANPDFLSEWDCDEISNTFLIGTQMPEKTLIKNIKRAIFSEFLCFPYVGVNKISPPQVNYDLGLTLDDCISRIYDLTLEALSPYSTNYNIDLFFSGGNDSTSIANLLKKTSSKFNCLTYLDIGHDMNTKNVYDTLELLEINSDVFNFNPDQILACQEKAIWHGESEMVGVNSLNSSLELLMAQKISNEAWTTGDYFHGNLHLKSSASDSMHTKFKNLFNYSILSFSELKQLMGENKNTLQIKPYLNSFNSYEILTQIHSVICPAALYRLRNRTINYSSIYFFPTRSKKLVEFINSIPESLTESFVKYNNSMIMKIYDGFLKKSLGGCYALNQKKAWMQALISSDKNNKIRNEIENYVLYESTFLKELFGKKLHLLLKKDGCNGVERYDNFLFCLWSMDIFNRQFINFKKPT